MLNEDISCPVMCNLRVLLPDDKPDLTKAKTKEFCIFLLYRNLNILFVLSGYLKMINSQPVETVTQTGQLSK